MKTQSRDNNRRALPTIRHYFWTGCRIFIYCSHWFPDFHFSVWSCVKLRKFSLADQLFMQKTWYWGISFHYSIWHLHIVMILIVQAIANISYLFRKAIKIDKMLPFQPSSSVRMSLVFSKRKVITSEWHHSKLSMTHTDIHTYVPCKLQVDSLRG